MQATTTTEAPRRGDWIVTGDRSGKVCWAEGEALYCLMDDDRTGRPEPVELAEVARVVRAR